LHLIVLVIKPFQSQEMQLSSSQEHAARTDVAYNLLDCMNLIAAYGLHAYTLPPPLNSWIC